MDKGTEEFLGKLPEWIGILVAWTAAGIALYQVRDLQRSRKGKESPHFKFSGLLAKHPDMEMWTYPVGSEGNVPENYPDGEQVIIQCFNKGSDSRNTEIESLTELPCEIGMHTLIAGQASLDIHYPFSVTRRGKKERFKVTYETVSGEKGEQVFEHLHGAPSWKRISRK